MTVMRQDKRITIVVGVISFLFFAMCGISKAGIYKYDQLLASVTGNTYYLDAVQGNDNNDGSQASPWKTLAKAQATAKSGDCVVLTSGDYGAFVETNHAGRDKYILYIANLNSSVHFDAISINNSSSTDTFLVFHGINMKPDWVDPCSTSQPGCNDPQYASSTQSTYAKTPDVVSITKANHVKIIDSHIEGQSKHLTVYGVSISGSQDVTVDHCDITKVQRGVNMMYSSTGVNVLNNHIHDIGASAIVQGNAGCTNALIEGNHAHNSKYSITDDYAPRLVGQEYHGSAVALRDGYVTIRNNVFHDGFPSSGIMTYSDGSNHYDNVIIENNLLYDIHNPYVLRLYYMGDSCVVRNNTFIGTKIVKGGQYIYNTALAVHSLDTDGAPHLYLSNNILIGASFFNEIYSTQKNNIFFSWQSNGVWQCSPLSGDSIVFTCKDYVYPTVEQVTDLFKCGSECDFNAGHGKTLDFSLSNSSQAINFGNAETQAANSLGLIGGDGFINDNGATRTATEHCAGAYEKIETLFGGPAPGGLHQNSLNQ
jgi:hypothetical protein